MTASLADALATFSPTLPLTVAYSGGADSTALLLACVRQWPGQVQAVHVHHGLQAAADAFERHCRDFCARLDVPLSVTRVHAKHAPGQSPEDAARRARYQAFESLALAGSAKLAIKDIAIAQHADDQVETILLALSRGSGLPGLSGMPARWTRGALTFHRPLLAVPAATIRAWLVAEGIEFIEDPSNTDERFTRNRIRANVLPALDATFVQFRQTFARSAAHAAQAQAVLQDVATQDLAEIGVPPVMAKLQALSGPRQANVVRHWLTCIHGTVPSTAQLDELLRQVAACRTRGHQLHLKVGAGFVVRQGAKLDWYNPSVLL